MIHGFIQFSVSGKQSPQIIMRGGMVGIELQGLLEISDRLVDLVLTSRKIAEVKIGLAGRRI